uniref:Macaca fascicularis brain cDNA clone: QflA-21341, similar to human Hermansky-Pudlak syndrome 1 (HPS1), transcript variant2, mRNA, RefSeq: NM_182637.1 n=1 Tax=Macaca fascicularis TaxID=9541 RepID=I7GHU1_MACFA|nr:unnamed protein product [Macaca fascicularis]
MPSCSCIPSCWHSTLATVPAPCARPTCSSSSSWFRTSTPARTQWRMTLRRQTASPSLRSTSHQLLPLVIRAQVAPSGWRGAPHPWKPFR